MAMSATQIQSQLKKRGWTHERVGALANPPLSATMILRNVRKIESHKSARAREAIAVALGRTVAEVFGETAGAGASLQKVG